MALTANQIIRVRRALHRAYSAQEVLIPWTKPDADAAIAALDSFLDTNAGAINAALPQPYRGSASAADKAVLLVALAIAQQLVDDPEYVDILRQILSDLNGIQGA